MQKSIAQLPVHVKIRRHFGGNLPHTVFTVWRDVAHEWNNARMLEQINYDPRTLRQRAHILNMKARSLQEEAEWLLNKAEEIEHRTPKKEPVSVGDGLQLAKIYR